MNEVLLSESHQEVGVKSDVELDIAGRSFCLRDVEVETLVKYADCLRLVAFLAPLDHSFKVGVLR
jgi:hypothetical protein